MSTVIVLDASFAMSLLREEATSVSVRAALDTWATDSVSLVAPAPFWAEIINSLTKRHGRPGSEVIEALFILDQLTITSVDVDRPLLLAGLDLVERSGLTIHDALYLALARSIGAKLATFEFRAARRRRVGCRGPVDVRTRSRAPFVGGFCAVRVDRATGHLALLAWRGLIPRDAASPGDVGWLGAPSARRGPCARRHGWRSGSHARYEFETHRAPDAAIPSTYGTPQRCTVPPCCVLTAAGGLVGRSSSSGRSVSSSRSCPPPRRWPPAIGCPT